MIQYRQATLWRIAFANSVGFAASTAVPLWVGSVGAHFGFAVWGAGLLATGQLACAALLNAVTPWLFRRVRLGTLAFAAAAVALLGNGLAWLGASNAFIVGCLLCGAGSGVLLNVTNRLVGGSSAPQRGYAVVQLAEVLFCIAFYLGVPPIIVRFGSLSVFAVLAGLCGTVFLLLAGVPGDAPESTVGTKQSDAPVNTPGRRVESQMIAAPPNAREALLSLCGAALVFAGYSAVSASLVSIGAAVGLSVLWVGRVMALGLLASLGGAVCARALGERAGLLVPLLVGAGVVGGDILAVTLGGGAAGFVGSSLILFIGIVFLSPYIYALLAGLDQSGRWASIAPAFVLTGVAFGPGLAGLVIRGMDFTTLGYTAFTCILGAMALFLCAQRLYLRGARAGTAQV